MGGEGKEGDDDVIVLYAEKTEEIDTRQADKCFQEERGETKSRFRFNSGGEGNFLPPFLLFLLFPFPVNCIGI